MRLEKCYFCSSTVYPGHGVTFVRNDCKVFRFCRSKCHKNFKMKRNPRKMAWTKAFRAAHGKELTADSTFEFERRRHVPVKYDRDLMSRTIQAMQRISEIRVARAARLHETRMKANKQKQKQQQRKELQQNLPLLTAPTVNVHRRSQLNAIVNPKQTKQQANRAQNGGSSMTD
jgi:large subunit ribosomal protein L24e